MTHQSKRCRRAIVACVCLASVAAASVGTTAETTGQTRPAQANPDLPQGAIRQLGSNRFRAGGQLGGVWLSRNGTRLTTLGSGLRIYDTESGQLLRHIQPRFVMNPLAEKERQGVLAWSPDGSIVAVATREKQLLVLDGESLESAWTTDTHLDRTAGTKLVACSPDGQFVAAGTDTGSVLIFDANGAITRELSNPKASPKMLWFRGTNNRLVSFWSDGTFREWDYVTGDVIRSGKRGPYWNYFPYALDSRGAKLSLTGGGLLTYYQIDENNKELRRSFRADDRTLTAATVSGDLEFMATAARDGLVRLFRTEDFSQVAELAGITAEVNYLSLSVDASLLAIGHKFAGNRVRIFRRQQSDEGAFRFVEQLPDDGHLAGITQLQFGANGTRLLSSSGPDNTSHLWEVQSGNHVVIEAAGRGSITSSGDGVAVSGLNSGNGVRLFDVADSAELKVARTINARKPVALSPDGRFVAAAPLPRQQAIAVWDRSTGELRCELPLSNSTCYVIAWSPDSQRLAIAGADETVRVYEVPSGKRIHEFVAAARYAMTFAGPNHLLTMQYDGRRSMPVAVRDLQSGAVVREINSDERIIELAANDDGLLVAGMTDGTVQLWNWKTGELRKELKGHAASVHAVAISPDGNTIASGSMDSLIYLWDVRSATDR